MKGRFIVLSVLLASISLSPLWGQTVRTVTFPSKDGLTITADYYHPFADSTKTIVLFHQAGSSRGEFNEIALELNRLGFNCLAVDLRSGNSMNGVKNETFQAAKAQMKNTQYLDAYRDMESAVEYVHHSLNPNTVLVLGSSYSAALAVRLGAEMPDYATAILVFSPGEYFKAFGKAPDYIKQFASKLTIPVYATAAKQEIAGVTSIFDKTPEAQLTLYKPETSGNHGAKALWQEFPDSRGYWDSTTEFLKSFE